MLPPPPTELELLAAEEMLELELLELLLELDELELELELPPPPVGVLQSLPENPELQLQDPFV